MHYVVQYLNAKGDQASIKVEAGTREEARWNSRIPERRIVAVREDILGQLVFELEPPGPDRKNQALFMQSLSSSLSSGKTVKQSVEKLVSKNRWLKAKPDKLEECDSLADYMSLFRFDHFAILMASAAEKAGDYSQALRQSAQFLLAREKIKSEVSAELKTGLIYIFVGLAFFFVVPAFLDNSMQMLMGVGNNGFVKPNLFTNILMGLGQFTKSYGWVIPIIAAACFLYRNIIWVVLKHLPLFNLIEAKRIQERSIEFISVYNMLQKAGYVDSEIVVELMHSTRGGGENGLPAGLCSLGQIRRIKRCNGD
jgi:type II secretory pathway component PulF